MQFNTMLILMIPKKINQIPNLCNQSTQSLNYNHTIRHGIIATHQRFELHPKHLNFLNHLNFLTHLNPHPHPHQHQRRFELHPKHQRL